MSIPAITLPGLDSFPVDLADALWTAFHAQPEGYVPRSHHLEPDGRPRYLNRLMTASSPYLLQHAHNPVNWYPWGEEAFAAAREADRPILLSVGYATCHWCHVMERESFEDEAIAGFMNRHFVNVKVDREERPDVDNVYMMAVQLMSGGGGWPMTVLMTPDGEPFFAGTYFPARDGDRGARVGFLTLLERIAEAWREQREQVASEARRLARAVEGANRPRPPEGVPGERVLVEAAHFLGRIFDPVWGGFGKAPKFPRPSTYELLLRYAHRAGDDAALHVVSHSLHRMSAGGLYDHVGGGFARYSTDREWLVPHFEKMLYDNAQLAALLTEAWQATGDARFAGTLRDTLDYVLREMTHPEGGFYSATDADSEGVEGKFFVWSAGEIREVLGPRAERFMTVYGVSEAGNFEGANVLHVAQPLDAVARAEGLSVDALRDQLDEDRARLRERRSRRTPPLLDDKILTEWNAQMIGALARAGFALGEDRYLSAATRAADFILGRLRSPSGELHRAWRHGRIGGRPVLEDYAFLAAGLLDLFEATSAPRWLREARATIDTLVDRFGDAEGGGFFATPADARPLLVRDKPSYDGAQPSGNSVAALTLLRLARLTGVEGYAQLARGTLLAFGRLLEDGAIQTPKLALALDWILDRPKEIVVVTTPEDPGDPLVRVVAERFVPNAVRVVGSAERLADLSKDVPWAAGKAARGGRATAYVCLEGVCRAPTSDPGELALQLAPEVRIEAPRLVWRT